MRLLLDTHIWLWMLTEPSRLGDARASIEDGSNELLLSAASSWEIAIKYAVGRLPLPEPPASYVPDRMRSTAVTPLPVAHTHVLELAALPALHRDPFDRLLVAQARLLGVPIVTGDAQVAAYDVETIGP